MLSFDGDADYRLRKGAPAVPDILIRGLDAETIRRLKTRAKQHGRSLQSELKLLVEQAGGTGAEQIAATFDRWQRQFAGRKFSSSVRLIREDRNR
jgi:antitoxin FitA